MTTPLTRRHFMAGTAAAMAAGLLPATAKAGVPVPYDWDASPPVDQRADYIAWMTKNRGEDPGFLGKRWDRFKQLQAARDIWDKRDIRAYLLTPREQFVTAANLGRAYEWHYLSIGYGVTITGPHTVARMTNSMDVKFGDRVLEIGTGSGYQSAYLSNLTDKVWSIEIIKPLAERTRRLYDDLIARGYTEFKSITTKNADGYYGWEQEAPVRQDHRHLRHRSHPAAAPAAAQAERHHRDPGRPARCPARAQGHQAAGGRRQDQRRALGHLRRRPGLVRAVHQARRRRDQGNAQRRQVSPRT